ncbi:preprotein translocase subunit SecG [Anaerotruncus sp. AF02-27]|jgi:protein translocase SecG subunit|nr:preprotein translocase subunit SecG [Anaerotruncus rubiinfantis]RGX54795.1 preprotein translocase subunit SecG [Anaerotruncus sp. AF02-27]
MVKYYELIAFIKSEVWKVNVFEIIGGIIILVTAVIIVITVMFQEGKGGGLNALSGSNESSYLGKNKNRSMQATMVRTTRYAGIIFVVVTLAVYFISAAMK